MLFVLGINNGFTLANFISRCKDSAIFLHVQIKYKKTSESRFFCDHKQSLLYDRGKPL